MWEIAALFGEGEPVEEIAALYRHVDPEAIRDAIGYYLDYQQQVDSREDGVIRFASVRND